MSVVISVEAVSKKYSRTDANAGIKFKNLRGFLPKILRGNKLGEISDNKDTFWALKDISFQVTKGQRVGIIGKNGAGKSTLLKILSRLIYPTEGEVLIRGRVTSLLEVGTGFNMNLSGRQNIYLNASLHGLDKTEIDAIFDGIVEFSGVGEFLDMPIKHYSSGMYMRLAFSVAAHLDPDILLMDEVLAVGDLGFQQKCLQRVENLASEGRTIVFVSHSMGDIVKFCNYLIWIDEGKIRFSGDVIEGIKLYQNDIMPRRSVDLNQRIDRSGTGLARLMKMHVLDKNQIPTTRINTGDELYLVFDYVFDNYNRRNISDVFISVVIENDKQQRLFGLPSEVIDVDLTNLQKDGKFFCHIPKLPLVPGTYFITVALLLNRQLVDKIVDAATLTVLEGDYYGTSRLPLRSFGEICVDFTWFLNQS